EFVPLAPQETRIDDMRSVWRELQQKRVLSTLEERRRNLVGKLRLKRRAGGKVARQRYAQHVCITCAVNDDVDSGVPEPAAQVGGVDRHAIRVELEDERILWQDD